MPLYVTVDPPHKVVRANRFLSGHPAPSGARVPTAAEMLRLCGGSKRDALFLHARWLVVEWSITWPGGSQHYFCPLRPGDWVIRHPVNGALHVMTDDRFHEKFVRKDR